MTKGFIIKKVELPADCYMCAEADEYGFCLHVGRYIDHYTNYYTGEGRYPTCPIVPYEEALKELEGVKE